MAKKMKYRIFKIVLGLIILNMITYLLFSEISSEKIVNQKFIEFSQRRLNNMWNVDTSEVVYVASCGDEFFRDIKDFEPTVRESNPKGTKSPNELHDDSGFYQLVWRVQDDIDVLNTIQTRTDNLNSVNCIIYKVCSFRTVPGIYKKIEYQFFYSAFPTNFHPMTYNGKMEGSTPIYLWLFGFWIEFNEEIYSL
jgi:hypothetical protein